ALSALSRVWEQQGYLLLSADAAAHASLIFVESGHQASATAEAARAESLATRCDSARTPALDDCEVPLPLTDREREIVKLAHDGLSNRDIAVRLVVNVRTVEGHLNRAFAKLGVSN